MPHEAAPYHVLLLGTDGCGKTTLTGQLRHIAQTSIPSALLQEANEQEEGDDMAVSVRLPCALDVAPTQGQEIDNITMNVIGGDVKFAIKEVGGRLVSLWPRFIRPEVCAFIFVLDAGISGPVMPATTSLELLNFMARSDAREKPILFVVNRPARGGGLAFAQAASSMSMEMLLRVTHVDLLLLECEQAGIDVTVVVVDTWTGEGVADVWLWLLRKQGGFVAK